MQIESILFGLAILILASVLSIKLSDRFSVPVLLLFLGLGILAGSEGLGGLEFDDPGLAKTIGIVALVFIIFSGGLDTNWKDTRSIIGSGLVLSSLGVLLTAVLTGSFAIVVLGFSPLQGLLLGSIISSTDAAAVFSILRSRRISLAKPLRPLLEFESGSNDPMAIFLTTSFIGVMSVGGFSVAGLVPRLLLNMGVGGLVGLVMGWVIVRVIRRLRLSYEGLYVVVASTFVQGMSLPLVAKWFKLAVPIEDRVTYPIEFRKTAAIDAEVQDTIVPYESAAVGKTIARLGVPKKCLILLLMRGGEHVIPSGSTVLEGGDVLLVLASKADFIALQHKLAEMVTASEPAS